MIYFIFKLTVLSMNFELYCSDLKHTAKFFDNEDLQ